MAKKKNILIVDDEKEVIQALEKFFSYKGYKISVASDGKEAISKLSLKPDLVILDIKMPTVDGIAVLKIIKKDYPATKTIVLTGFANDYKEETEKIGADAFLTKPFSLEKLVATTGLILSNKEALPEEKVNLTTADLYLVAKAKILIYPSNSITYGNIAAHLRRVHYSGGVYELQSAYNDKEFIEMINSFKPDIVLVDIAYFGINKNLTKEIFQQKHHPNDLIIFGTPGDETPSNTLDKKTVGGFFDPLSTAFNKSYMNSLLDTLRQTCIQHKLCQKWEKRWDIDYEKKQQEEIQKQKEREEKLVRRSDYQKMPVAINQILAKNFKTNQWHIKPENNLKKDFKTSDFTRISAISEIERYFDINIPYKNLEKIKTVKDIYSCISKLVFNKEYAGN